MSAYVHDYYDACMDIRCGRCRLLIRYMYVPLGGRSTRVWNVWPVFLFVAIWHDIEWKLVVWGLLNASFYVIEVIDYLILLLLICFGDRAVCGRCWGPN